MTHPVYRLAKPQGRALCELRSLEETSAALSSAIQEGQLAKQQLLDDMVEAERQIMLAERKIQLEKEMQVRAGWQHSLSHASLGTCSAARNEAGSVLGAAVLGLAYRTNRNTVVKYVFSAACGCCRRCWTPQSARVLWRP